MPQNRVSEKESDLLRLEVRCNRDAPCLVREALDDALAGSELLPDARLVASELITNAVLYSGCGPDQLLEFRVIQREGSLVISVSDPCLAGQTAHLRSDGDSGFGLRIVDRVAQRWGAEHPNGQRVWAELSMS
jgi:anti-sigma regulatory factor (Ser/Thr protein kinase)